MIVLIGCCMIDNSMFVLFTYFAFKNGIYSHDSKFYKCLVMSFSSCSIRNYQSSFLESQPYTFLGILPCEIESLSPYGLYGSWNSPGQNTGMGSLSLLQGIFPTQGLNPGLLCCGQFLYQLSHFYRLFLLWNYILCVQT